MERLDFTPYRRSTVGFDRLFDLLERQARATAGDNYPPFNIERRGDDSYRITLAVAGFSVADLSVHVEDSQLVIRGRQTEEAGRVFLHRGIAARQFQRSFVLAEGLEVTGAALDNGLLNVDLERPPATSRVRRIEIRDLEGSGRVAGDRG